MMDPLPVIPKRRRGPYRRDLCSDSSPPLLVEGIGQFNRGEFFEQHETLEALWRAEPDDVRYLYQGILQLGVGFLHLQRGNYKGGVSRLEAGLEKLGWFLPACQGVDVARLMEEVTSCLTRLRELGPERVREFEIDLVPKVHAVMSSPHPFPGEESRWGCPEGA